jgi:hypothetical protein
MEYLSRAAAIAALRMLAYRLGHPVQVTEERERRLP